MICKLCRSNEAIEGSHVLPELLYKHMYNTQQHRFFSLDERSDGRPTFFHKGLREPLLCKACEQKFSRYENYAALVLHGGRGSRKPPSLRCSRAGKFLRWQGIEYAPTKLFLMSLLWRLGVTTLESLKGVSLGDRHEAKLRAMLLADNPGGIDDYPCHMAAITLYGKFRLDLIVPPAPGRDHAHHLWSFAAGGLCFFFHVSSHRQTSEIPLVVPHPGGHSHHADFGYAKDSVFGRDGVQSRRGPSTKGGQTGAAERGRASSLNPILTSRLQHPPHPSFSPTCVRGGTPVNPASEVQTAMSGAWMLPRRLESRRGGTTHSRASIPLPYKSFDPYPLVRYVRAMTVMRESLTAREARREIEALRAAGEKIRQTPETAKAFPAQTRLHHR